MIKNNIFPILTAICTLVISVLSIFPQSYSPLWIFLLAILGFVFAFFSAISPRKILGKSYPKFINARQWIDVIISSGGFAVLKNNKESNFIEFNINKALSETELIESNIVFAKTQKDAEIATDLNLRAFRWGQWDDSRNKKFNRNYGFIRKNNKTMSLLKVKNKNIHFTENFKGFVSILPLTKDGFDLYIKGNIKDNDFTSEYIAEAGSDVHALLLFSVGFLSNRKKTDNINFLILAVLRHIAILAKDMNLQNKEMPIIYQNNSKSIENFMYRFGFEKKNIFRTRDKENVFSLSIKFL